MPDIEEVRFGESLLTFDGRILELFGFPGTDSYRFNVKNLRIQIADPDRKGRRMVQLMPVTKGLKCAVEVEEQDWQAVGALLDRAGAAAASAG